MVLDPLERMIEKVKIIAANPMSAATEEVNQAGVFSVADSDQKRQTMKKLKKSRKKNDDGQFIEFDEEDEDNVDEKDLYETDVLERAIVKIGYLLALGFGEAGASIIGQNMTQGGDLNPMMPGQKTTAIFGFCILDQFVECTEVLQADIMKYVNRVAEITHSMVDRYGGSANKNIGDAFLLVWKFHDPKEIQLLEEANGGNYSNRDICIEN